MRQTNLFLKGLRVCSFGLLILSFASCGRAPESQSQLTEMDDVVHHVETVATPQAVVDQLKGKAAKTTGELSANKDGVRLAAIINTAKATWKFIEDNEAVSNISYDYANALPEGAGLTELSGFSDLQYTSYRMYGKNLFGITVYDVTYTLVHQYGGSYDGEGRYLATVSVLPSNVDVLWGYTVDFTVNKVSVTNVGSAVAPVASAVMELSFKVSTIIKKHTSTLVYQFRGDSSRVR